MLSRYWKMLVAIIGGNLLYFLALSPHLPPAARHRREQFDWGLVIDFWVCLACYGLLTSTFRSRSK